MADRPEGAARRHHHPAAGPLHLRQPLLQRHLRGPAGRRLHRVAGADGRPRRTSRSGSTPTSSTCAEEYRARCRSSTPAPSTSTSATPEGRLSWRTVDLEPESLEASTTSRARGDQLQRRRHRLRPRIHEFNLRRAAWRRRVLGSVGLAVVVLDLDGDRPRSPGARCRSPGTRCREIAVSLPRERVGPAGPGRRRPAAPVAGDGYSSRLAVAVAAPPPRGTRPSRSTSAQSSLRLLPLLRFPALDGVTVGPRQPSAASISSSSSSSLARDRDEVVLSRSADRRRAEPGGADRLVRRSCSPSASSRTRPGAGGAAVGQFTAGTHSSF